MKLLTPLIVCQPPVFPPLRVVFVFFRLGETSFNKYDLNFILSSVSSVPSLAYKCRMCYCAGVWEDQWIMEMLRD